MADAKNLADPEYEPSDEDLQTLAREAFADVALRHAQALERLRAEIAALRDNHRATKGDRRPSQG